MRSFTFMMATLALLACTATQGADIDRDRAIAIARQQVKFEPVSVEAETGVESGREVWRVTLRGKPQPFPMAPLMIVTLDRHSGDIVALERN